MTVDSGNCDRFFLPRRCLPETYVAFKEVISAASMQIKDRDAIWADVAYRLTSSTSCNDDGKGPMTELSWQLSEYLALLRGLSKEAYADMLMKVESLNDAWSGLEGWLDVTPPASRQPDQLAKELVKLQIRRATKERVKRTPYCDSPLKRDVEEGSFGQSS